MVTMEEVAANIVAERSRKRMSRSDLADASGVGKDALGTYERASAEIPLTKAVAIADALGVPISAIAGRP